MLEIIGWASSCLLLATLIQQVYKQWQEGTSEGVSKWLFIGQFLVSVGFTIYSIGKGDLVFIVTNAALAVNALLGVYIWFRTARGRKKASG
ncbi:MAG TPA: SemiSWEET family transporter [Pyrinomonadaceae bacterium]|nr:SemiSWEET family transporter [Pyrinomonadaceae bacterium]